MQPPPPNHYAVLGLDHKCTDAQVRAAYRILAKQHHPDLHASSPEAIAQTQRLNAAYAVLSDPDQRRAYDEARAATPARKRPTGAGRSALNLTQDVQLRLEDFLRGVSLEVAVQDPGNPEGPESYPLTIPPETAPGARFRVARTGPGAGGVVTVRVKARPDFHFKVRGSDLRCDLRIRVQRAAQGGTETVRGLGGNFLRVNLPPRVARGEIVRLVGEGLPKPRGGRGDLLVRVLYTPEVRIRRATGA